MFLAQIVPQMLQTLKKLLNLQINSEYHYVTANGLWISVKLTTILQGSLTKYSRPTPELKVFYNRINVTD